MRSKWYAVERGTSILLGHADAPHVFDTCDIAQEHADHKLKQKRDMERDLGKRLDWPEYEPISVMRYRQKYGGITKTMFSRQCADDVRALLNRIQRDIAEAR